MPMDPAQFYQLGAQAGAARMGGLPENLDKNRLMSMQMAPSLMEIPIKQQQAENQMLYQQTQDKRADAYLQQITNQQTQAQTKEETARIVAALGYLRSAPGAAAISKSGIGRVPKVDAKGVAIPGKYQRTGWGMPWDNYATDPRTALQAILASLGQGNLGPSLTGESPDELAIKQKLGLV